MTLTVLSWLWTQNASRTRYTAHHVNIWRDMVARNLSMPHRIACVTDDAEGIDPRIEIIAPPRDFEDVRIPTWGPERPQCLRRLSMVAPDAARIFGERFVCMDLDCIVTGPLDPMLDRGEDFMIAAGTAPNRPYNGSMMLLRAGTRSQVYERFTPELAAEAGRSFVGSDQAWISHCLGAGETTWSGRDGLIFHGDRRQLQADGRIVFFPGAMKPWDLIDEGNAAAELHYRRDARGKCLILGYHETVWSDLARVFAKGHFEAAIVSPEASEHWSALGLDIPVLAVAKTDRHAVRLAAMHGFTDFEFCGRQRGAA